MMGEYVDGLDLSGKSVICLKIKEPAVNPFLPSHGARLSKAPRFLPPAPPLIPQERPYQTRAARPSTGASEDRVWATAAAATASICSRRKINFPLSAAQTHI
jgi:hypothetical protein